MKHFWYSEKQEKTIDRDNGLRALIGGKVFYYTACSDTEEHGCRWDDMIYLGQGELVPKDFAMLHGTEG